LASGKIIRHGNPLGADSTRPTATARSSVRSPTRFERLAKVRSTSRGIAVLDGGTVTLLSRKGANVSSLRDRVALLFGRYAQLTVSARPPAMTLHLPRLQEEDPDDDGLDR